MKCFIDFIPDATNFVRAGMYDFQMVEDVNIACTILSSDLKRERPWRR